MIFISTLKIKSKINLLEQHTTPQLQVMIIFHRWLIWQDVELTKKSSLSSYLRSWNQELFVIFNFHYGALTVIWTWKQWLINFLSTESFQFYVEQQGAKKKVEVTQSVQK